MNQFQVTITNNSHVWRVYFEPGTVLKGLPCIVSLNLHNKPMWTGFSYIIPILQVRNRGTQWLSHLPELHSWKTLALKFCCLFLYYSILLAALPEAAIDARPPPEDRGLKLSSGKLNSFTWLV